MSPGGIALHVRPPRRQLVTVGDSLNNLEIVIHFPDLTQSLLVKKTIAAIYPPLIPATESASSTGMKASVFGQPGTIALRQTVIHGLKKSAQRTWQEAAQAKPCLGNHGSGGGAEWE